MHTHATDDKSVGQAAKEVAEHASSLARLELELAATELKSKASALGKGAGFGAGALFFVLYVTILLLLGAGVLGALAVRSLKRGTPPVPKQAIEEAKLTTTALKADGS
jgi:putative superfamily III holin-X